jgi:hypothetical protein
LGELVTFCLLAYAIDLCADRLLQIAAADADHWGKFQHS